jgi:RHS repeat-associated protein
VPPPNVYGGPTNQSFSYDDLYRLTHSQGTYQFSPSKSHSYTMDMVYDTIHNITRKTQADAIIEPSGVSTPQKKVSYDFTYAYNPSGPTSTQPHAPNHIGVRTYTYDADGNQTGWTHDTNGTRRTITWDDENRIQAVFDNGHEKDYKYDDQGQRVIKRGPQGETVYVNQFYTQRPGATGTKQIYAGTSRIAAKLVKQDTPNSNPNGNTPFEKDIFFYHPDHLGSSNYVTDLNGKLYEHLEYFPFGESWVEENSNSQRTPYLFSAKELDEETGLYYFGGRYYDPRTSVWQSPDPLLGKYFPNRAEKLQLGDNWNAERDLPGRGGVFASINIDLYAYGRQNPIRYVDPDGKLSFPWHFGITYKAARDSGKSFTASMSLAWDAMAVDWRKGSQGTDAEHTRMHAMAGKQKDGTYQSKEQAIQETKKFIEQSIKGGDTAAAVHAGEDLPAGGHGGHEWKGFTFSPIPFSKDIMDWEKVKSHFGDFTETVEHIWKDTFPSLGTIREAYGNAVDIIKREPKPEGGE